MVENPTAPENLLLQAPTFQSPQYRLVYANVFSFRPTGVDLSVTFGVQIPVGRPSASGGVALGNLEEVTIALTLASAKAMSRNLNKMVELIERNYGAIRVGAHSVFTDEQVAALEANMKQNPLVDVD